MAAEYIDREALNKMLVSYLNAPHVQSRTHIGQGMRVAIRGCIDLAESLPAADVAPVVHGEWIPIADGDMAECSECGECYNPGNNGGMTEFNLFKKFYKFCPTCGAKMDGDERHGVSSV